MNTTFTGHPKVDAIAHIRFEGDITPKSWFKHICYQTKKGERKADRLAVDILSDIVYWYRPYQKRDEITGEAIGWQKKFTEDLLRRSPDAFAETLNASVRCVRESMKLLEHMGLISIVLRPVKTAYGVIPNVMHIDINPDAIAAITYRPQFCEAAETTEKSLLTKWVTTPHEIVTNHLRNRNQPPTKSSQGDDEIGNSSIYIDFSETTPEISVETISPCSPPGDMNASEELVEVEVMEAGQEAVDTPSLENPKESSLLEQSSTPGKDKKCGGGVATLNVCDKKTGITKTQDQEMADCFLAAYLEHKPSNFTAHQRLTSEHLKKIKALTKIYGDRSLIIFVGALTWCREQKDDWWRKDQFSLSNLMSNGKLEDYADKHFHALDTDPAYCDRVEGRAISKDPKRNNGFQVFNEQGKEITGASARAAAAVANDPGLALFLEQI